MSEENPEIIFDKCLNCVKGTPEIQETLAGILLRAFCKSCVERLRERERESSVLMEFLPGFLQKN